MINGSWAERRVFGQDISNEKLIEFGQHRVIDTAPNLVDTYRPFDILRDSLVERYKEGGVSFHFHFLSEDESRGTNRNFCAVVSGTESGLDRGACFRTDELGLREMNGRSDENYPTVLVNVAKGVEDSQQVVFDQLPIVVRLQSLISVTASGGTPTSRFLLIWSLKDSRVSHIGNMFLYPGLPFAANTSSHIK